MKIQIASNLHLELYSHHERELHDFHRVEDGEALVFARKVA